MCYNIIPDPTDEQVTNCERLAGNLNIPLKKSYTDTVDSYQTIDG
ncbi:hypothetical protein [Treponema pedis]|nr:hypothetical protein [Treponema pedis]